MNPRLIARLLPFCLFGACALWLGAQQRSEEWIQVGISSIEITPQEPIRLSGYGSRKTPSEGINQPLHAKALAIGDGSEDSPLSVLVTLDAIGVPAWVTAGVSERLKAKKGVEREQLVIAASHTHAGPALNGCIPYMFIEGITPEEKAVVDKFTDGLLDKLEAVALKAIENRQPGKVDWGKGRVTFAGNRRVLKDGVWAGFGTQEDGPVDHSLPMLRVMDASGKLIGVLVNYACHCTTLGGNFNQIHADWAGYAQAEMEKRHPGAIAMVAIGCGADQNPNPRGELENAEAHGVTIADEVDRLLKTDLSPLTTVPQGRYQEIEISLQELPTREEWEAMVAEGKREAVIARVMLEKLENNEPIETAFAYPVQSWAFGDDLAMVFLAGEVVVDYSLRLYRELDEDRLWVSAYCNDLPCYIPSKRLFPEGGYEVDSSRVYYGKPARLAEDTEELIVGEILDQVGERYR